MPHDKAAFTHPLALLMSSSDPWRSFTAAITLPMSFRLSAPSSAAIALIAACASSSKLRGQEILDHDDLGRLDVGQFLRGRPVRTSRSIRGAA